MTPEQNTEQELANALSSKIDGLLSGAPIPSDDPLLNIAGLLKGESIQPSAAANARFEQQLSQWFPRPARPYWQRILPLIILVITIIVVAVIFGFMILPMPQSPQPGQETQPIVGVTTTFVRIVVSGSIETVQGSTITILGKTIVVEGTMLRLCAGDVIRIEAVLDSDGSLRAKAKSITVQTSACSIQPPQSSGGMGDMGGDD